MKKPKKNSSTRIKRKNQNSRLKAVKAKKTQNDSYFKKKLKGEIKSEIDLY